MRNVDSVDDDVLQEDAGRAIIPRNQQDVEVAEQVSGCLAGWFAVITTENPGSSNPRQLGAR